MKFFNSFLKYYFPPDKLHTYIHSRDKNGFKMLLKAGFDPNATCYGMPALQCAFINNASEFAFELLEHEANPNAIYFNEVRKQRFSLLESVLQYQSYEHARLLALYGANLVEGYEHPPMVQEAHKLYINNIKPYQNQHTVEAYEKLTEIWQQISHTETDTVLKECYLKKAEKYAQKTQELSTQVLIENSSHPSKSTLLHSKHKVLNLYKRLT
jgi:hypothetical protein